MATLERHELLKAVCSLLDGTLEPASAFALEQQLTEDAAAYEFYRDVVALDVDLEWSYVNRAKQRPLAAGSAVIAAAPEPCDLALSDSAEPTTLQPSLPALISPRSRFFSRPILRYVALVALCLYGSFVLVAWNLRPDQRPSVAHGDDVAVAMVSSAADVHWSQETTPKQDDSLVHQGESLKIDSGLVQLELKSGAILAVEGPAEWTVDGDNKVTLRFGKLIATVSAQAIGFTIETPTATVIDLGTKFAVETDQHGATEVQVIEGKIELQPGAAAGGSSPTRRSITLSAGSARRIEPGKAGGAPIVREIAATLDHLDKPSGPVKSRQIRVEGTLASNEFPGWGARRLIDGSGMHGDRHDDVPYTMWMTYEGKIKREFVLFDLSRPYRLESMKVWNFNDGRSDLHKSRGVKRASIYVAMFGKGNPLTNPDDWKLVAEDHEFAVASGTADYSTPDVIPLGGVVARFAAIVVDENHGPDLLGGVPTENKQVGLSEVQFFGFDERAQQSAVKRKEVGSKDRN